MTTLRIHTREQETFEAAFAAQIREFRTMHPEVEVEVITRPIHEHYEVLVEQRGAADPQVDLFLCCTDWLPTAIQQSTIRDLTDIVSANPPEGWPEGWHAAMHRLVWSNERLYGIPWHDGPQVFMVRKPLFDHPSHQKQFEDRFGRALTIPATWDEFVEVGTFFTHPENDEWGAVVAGLTDGHNNVYDFLIQLWSRGGQLLDEIFEPKFSSEIGAGALTFLHDLFHVHRIVSPECLALGSVESGDFYAQGKAAMMWNWCGFASVCELPELSKIVGENFCTRLPGGDGGSTSLNIYWALTLGSGSKHPELAYEFMRCAASPAMDKVTSVVGAIGTRLSTWRDPAIRKQYPHYSSIEDVHESTLTLPAIHEYHEINEAISRAVHRVVHERQPAKPSLERAEEEVRAILKASGRLK